MSWLVSLRGEEFLLPSLGDGYRLYFTVTHICLTNTHYCTTKTPLSKRAYVEALNRAGAIRSHSAINTVALFVSTQLCSQPAVYQQLKSCGAPFKPVCSNISSVIPPYFRHSVTSVISYWCVTSPHSPSLHPHLHLSSSSLPLSVGTIVQQPL